MEPREEVEGLAKELFEVCCFPDPTKWEEIKEDEKDVWKYRASIILDKYSLHPQQCKKELKELDFKVIFDMLFDRTQYSVDSCKDIADEICKKFGSPVSKEVKYPNKDYIILSGHSIEYKGGFRDGFESCIEECKRLNGNEGI